MGSDEPPRVFCSYTAEDLSEHAGVVRDTAGRLVQWMIIDHEARAPTAEWKVIPFYG
jgi:hypothetical protein